MAKLEVVGLTLAAILFLSFGCGCIGDAPVEVGADMEIYLDGVLVNTFVRELPVGLLYSEQAYAEGVHNLLIDGSVVESVTVIGNTVSIYLISGEPTPTKPKPTPEPTPEPMPTPVMFEYTVNIYVDGNLITSMIEEVESGKIEKYLKDVQREFERGGNVLYVDVTRSGRTIMVNIVSIPAHTPIPEPTSISTVPDNYYNTPQMVRTNVIDWLLSDWEKEYENNGNWDCSRMSAYTEYFLENSDSGMNVDFKIALIPGHAFVVWETTEGMVLYEATAAKIYTEQGRVYTKGILGITSREMFDFEIDHLNEVYFKNTPQLFSTIYEVEEYMNTHNTALSFEEEFGWWLE